MVFNDSDEASLGIQTLTPSTFPNGYTDTGIGITCGTTAPTAAWLAGENAQGQVVVNEINAGGSDIATLDGITYLQLTDASANSDLSFDVLATPVAGGSLTVATPTDGALGTLVVDGPGNDTLTFDSADTSYWHTGDGNDTATLEAGLTEIYLAGPRGDYTLAYNGASQLVVTDTNDVDATGTKTLDLAGGTAQLVFGDGSTNNLGGAGAAYEYGRSYGLLTINNGAGPGAASGVLGFATGVSAVQLWFEQSEENLVMYVLGSSTDSVTVTNWFANSSAQLAKITLADGSILQGAQVAALVAAMASYASATSSFNPQTATAFPVNTALTAALNTAWAQVITGTPGNDTLAATPVGNDMVIGEAGNDTLSAGTGADTFRFAPGDGTDTITNFNPALDTVHIAGTAAAPVIHAFPSDILFDDGGTAAMWAPPHFNPISLGGCSRMC